MARRICPSRFMCVPA